MTVAEALLTVDDARGWIDADRHLGLSLAERVRNGVDLSAKQQRSGYRLLRKYDGKWGLDYGSVSPPDGDSPAPSAPHLLRPNHDIVRVVCEGDRIKVRAPYRFRDTCRGVPGSRWVKAEKAWTYPQSATSAAHVRDAFIATAVDADERFAELVEEYDAATARSASIREDEEPPDIPLTKTTPWRHQRRAFWFAKELTAAGLYLDMGTGKTKCAVDLFCNAGARTGIVLSPHAVVPVWQREFRIHGGVDVHVVSLQKGTIAQRTALADNAIHECRCGRPHVVVTNYEAAWRDPFASWALDQEWDYAIADEAHRLKAPGGRQSKFCSKLRKRAARRLALTGTPMPQAPLDVFGMYRFLDPNILGTSFATFRSKFALMGGYGGHEVVGYQELEELNRLVYSIAYRVTAEEVLDLPPDRDVTIEGELPPRTRKLYRQLENDLYAEIDAADLAYSAANERYETALTRALEDGIEPPTAPVVEVTIANVLVKLLRLQQLTGGAITDDEKNVIEVDSGKEELLVEYLDQLPHSEPVVVFCRYRHDLDVVERVAGKQGRKYGELSGRRRDATDSDAKMSTDVDVVGVQIQSGGEGIDLTRAAYACYYSLGFALKDYLQSRARLVRPGQERPVLFTHLVMTGTVDERVYEALAERKEVVDYVLGLHRSEVAASKKSC